VVRTSSILIVIRTKGKAPRRFLSPQKTNRLKP
jgi:hypothetical protein